MFCALLPSCLPLSLRRRPFGHRPGTMRQPLAQTRQRFQLRPGGFHTKPPPLRPARRCHRLRLRPGRQDHQSRQTVYPSRRRLCHPPCSKLLTCVCLQRSFASSSTTGRVAQRLHAAIGAISWASRPLPRCSRRGTSCRPPATTTGSPCACCIPTSGPSPGSKPRAAARAQSSRCRLCRTHSGQQRWKRGCHRWAFGFRRRRNTRGATGKDRARLPPPAPQPSQSRLHRLRRLPTHLSHGSSTLLPCSRCGHRCCHIECIPWTE